MKNFTLKSVFAAFLFIFAFGAFSCKNDKEKEEVKPTPEPATITFTSPAMHSTVNAGDVVTVSGKIAAAKQIHGYKITIRNKATQAETVIKDAHDHGTDVDFSATWTNDVTDHADMEAEVVVTLDHDGNKTIQKVSFHAMP